jgi:hypothetical protein
MFSVLLIGFSYILVTGTSFDPCWFVAMRELRKPSSCNTETKRCEGIFHRRDGGQGFSPYGDIEISCDLAGQHAGSMFRNLPSGGMVESVDISYLLMTKIVPALRKVVITGVCPSSMSDGVEQAIHDINLYLVDFIATCDDISELNVMRLKLVSSESFLDYMSLLRFHLKKMSGSPLFDIRQQTDQIPTFAKLGFDILSVIQVDHDEDYLNLLVSIRDGSPAARLPISVFHNVSDGYKIAALIETLSMRRSDMNLSIANLVYFFENLEFNRARHGAATEITIAHIRSSICPEIESVISYMPRGPKWVSVASSLIALCSGVVSISSLARANQYLLRYIENENPTDRDWLLDVDDTEVLQAAEALLRGGMDWVLPSFDSSIRDKSSFFVNILNVLDPFVDAGEIVRLRIASEFESTEKFQNTMLAFGRLCGIYILNGLKVGPLLRLPVEYYALIHTYSSVEKDTIIELLRSNDVIEGLEDVEEVVFEFVTEPIFFIRLGMKELLGPAGVEMFTPLEWSDLFRKISPREKKARTIQSL